MFELEIPERTVRRQLIELSKTRPKFAQEAWDLVPKGSARKRKLKNARKIFLLLEKAANKA